MAYSQDHEVADLKFVQTTSAGAEDYGETTGLSRDEKDMIRMGKVQETKVRSSCATIANAPCR
jgi:hypothetical protein